MEEGEEELGGGMRQSWDKAKLEEGKGRCWRGVGTKQDWKQGKGNVREELQQSWIKEGEGVCRRGDGTKLDWKKVKEGVGAEMGQSWIGRRGREV